MPRHIIKRFIPDREKLKESWYLRPFYALLHDPVLLHVNRHNTCKALALGLLVAFLPLPFQTAIAAGLAVWLRVNVLVAIAGTFFSNPITSAPVNYACYKLGAWLLQLPEQPFHIEFTLKWLLEELSKFWQPFLLGTVIIAVLTATIAYFSLNFFWQWYVMRQYRRRPAARRRKNSQ